MDIFSNLQVIGECLLDKKRTLAFKKAIKETINKGDVVLDSGTGSGILAMFSAKAGAKKVYAIEIAKDVVKFANENVRSNKLGSIVKVINKDIKELKLKQKLDMVTMEMLDTGMVSEQQAQAINQLHKLGLISKDTKLVPYRLDSFIELVDFDFDFYGLDMPFVIQARNDTGYKKIKKKLSRTILYDSVDFSSKVNETVDTTIKIKITKNGTINALRLRSKTFLSPKITLWETPDLNMPVIIPLNKKNVKKGQIIELKITYKMGLGFDQLRASIL